MGLQNNKKFVGKGEVASVVYHNIFDYPLSTAEIIKWPVGKKGLACFSESSLLGSVVGKSGQYFLKGKENILYQKLLKKRISRRKLSVAQRAGNLLGKIPMVRGVFVTGTLAMQNAEEGLDIDLMIITKRNSLWTTRLLVYGLLWVMGYKLRKPGQKSEKNKLCINLWLDESMLSWNKYDRNIYSAHEIAQVVPLINKNKIYERFIEKNKWILDYWPSAVKLPQDTGILGYKDIRRKYPVSFLEKLAFRLQYLYMKPKITREVVTLHKAIFHPHNWGEIIIKKLSS